MSSESLVDGKTVVITGTTNGIGTITARELLAAGARVFMLNRSAEKTAALIDSLDDDLKCRDRVHGIVCDLASLTSVRRAAKQVLSDVSSIDILILNAGLAGWQGETEDGWELAWGVNHLAHALLTHLLFPSVVNAGGQVIVVASRAHYDCSALSMDDPTLRGRTRALTGLPEYQRSKFANVAFARRLARHCADNGISVRVNALHPGVVATEIWNRIPWLVRVIMKSRMITPADGAKTTLHLCLSPDAQTQTGLYWDECKPKEPNDLLNNSDLVESIWEHTLKVLGIEEWGQEK